MGFMEIIVVLLVLYVCNRLSERRHCPRASCFRLPYGC